MAGFDALVGDMEAGRRSLVSHWELTRGSWNDALSQHFAEKYVLPLDKEYRDMIQEMDRAFVVISKARAQFRLT
jgi:hypothetical protein